MSDEHHEWVFQNIFMGGGWNAGKIGVNWRCSRCGEETITHREFAQDNVPPSLIYNSCMRQRERLVKEISER